MKVPCGTERAASWPARMSRTGRLRGGRRQESHRAVSRWTANANYSLGSPQIDGTEGVYGTPHWNRYLFTLNYCELARPDRIVHLDRPWRRSGRRQGLGEHTGHQPARHRSRNDCVHDRIDPARDDNGPADADLLASPLPSMSASIFRAREAGTRAFMMLFSRPGTILERFLSRPLRPSDTHCSMLIGFIGMIFGSKPNFSSTAVLVNPAASTVTWTPRGWNS